MNYEYYPQDLFLAKKNDINMLGEMPVDVLADHSETKTSYKTGWKSSEVQEELIL